MARDPFDDLIQLSQQAADAERLLDQAATAYPPPLHQPYRPPLRPGGQFRLTRWAALPLDVLWVVWVGGTHLVLAALNLGIILLVCGTLFMVATVLDALLNGLPILRVGVVGVGVLAGVASLTSVWTAVRRKWSACPW